MTASPTEAKEYPPSLFVEVVLSGEPALSNGEISNIAPCLNLIAAVPSLVRSSVVDGDVCLDDVSTIECTDALFVKANLGLSGNDHVKLGSNVSEANVDRETVLSCLALFSSGLNRYAESEVCELQTEVRIGDKLSVPVDLTDLGVEDYIEVAVAAIIDDGLTTVYVCLLLDTGEVLESELCVFDLDSVTSDFHFY